MNNTIKIMTLLLACSLSTATLATDCKNPSSPQCKQLQSINKYGGAREVELITPKTTDKPKAEKKSKPFAIPIPRFFKSKKSTKPKTTKPTTESKKPTIKKAEPIDINIFSPKTTTTKPPKKGFKFTEPTSPLKPVIGKPPTGIQYQ